MLRCIQCGSEGEFLVDELAWHSIRVRSGNTNTCDGATDWSDYTYVDDEEFQEVKEWGDVTCCACKHVMGEEKAKQACEWAHPAITVPIPYTLVDASIT